MSAQLPSRVPVVTDWLIANLPTATGIPAAQISDGPPTEAQLRSTCIIIGDTDMEQEFAALGARNRNEYATIRLVIYVIGQGGQTVINNAAFTILASIETYLRTGTNITAGSNVVWIEVVPTTIAKQQGDNARAAFLAADLKFFARI